MHLQKVTLTLFSFTSIALAAFNGDKAYLKSQYLILFFQLICLLVPLVLDASRTAWSRIKLCISVSSILAGIPGLIYIFGTTLVPTLISTTILAFISFNLFLVQRNRLRKQAEILQMMRSKSIHELARNSSLSHLMPLKSLKHYPLRDDKYNKAS